MHDFQPGQRRIGDIQPPQDATGMRKLVVWAKAILKSVSMAMAGQAIRVLLRGLNFSSLGVSVKNLPRKRLQLPLPSAAPSVRSSGNGLLVLVDWLMSLPPRWRGTQRASRGETLGNGLGGRSRLS